MFFCCCSRCSVILICRNCRGAYCVRGAHTLVFSTASSSPLNGKLVFELLITTRYSSNRKLVWAGRCHLPGGVRTYFFFMKLSSVFIMFFVLARWLGRSTVARTSNERMLRPLFSACVTAGISSQPQSRRGTLYSYSYSYTRLYTRLHYRCLI